MDAEREWFKATVGMSVTEVPRAKSLSAETIQQNDVVVVNDTLSDARFRDKFLVNGDPRIRFYAGAPLATPSGHKLGTICVMDREPRTFGEEQAAALKALGQQVMSQQPAELRRLRAEDQTAEQELKSLLDVNVAVGRHLERDELFGAIASCLRNILETDRFGIELPIAGNQLQGHILGSTGADAPTQPTVLPAEGTVCHWVIESRRWFVASSRDELRERFPVTFDQMQRYAMESLCTLPLTRGERCVGVLFFMAGRRGAYQDLRRGSFDQKASAVGVALDHCLRRRRKRLRAAAQIGCRRRERLHLREEIQTRSTNFSEIIGNSPALLSALERVERVVRRRGAACKVLILGEAGSEQGAAFAREGRAQCRTAGAPIGRW